MGQVTQDIENIQIETLLVALEITLFITYIQLNGIFSNKVWENLWVVTHRSLLSIYIYHGVNIAEWLK